MQKTKGLGQQALIPFYYPLGVIKSNLGSYLFAPQVLLICTSGLIDLRLRSYSFAP